MGNQSEALNIYQRVLDEMTKAVMEGDAKLIASYLHQPFHMRTAGGWFPICTFDDVDQLVSSMHFSFKIQGVTDYERIASQAKFLGADEIEGFHTTHVFRGGRAMIAPYENRMKMKKIGDDWRVTIAEHSLENFKWPLMMPKVKSGTLEHLRRNTKNDAVAMEIYQNFINELTRANLEGDHDAWSALCEFPHKVKIDNIEQIIESPDGSTSFLNTMSKILEEAIDSEFKREANFAGFLGDDIIRGYHTTTLGGPNSSTFRPIQSRITIRRTDNKWRIIELVNSIANTEFPYEKPIISDTLISEFHNPRKALRND